MTADESLSGDRVALRLRQSGLTGRLQDVSMGGLAMWLDRQLKPGERVVLRIANRSLARHVDMTGEVLRAQPGERGGWNIVCRFDARLTFEQIHFVGRHLFAATIV